MASFVCNLESGGILGHTSGSKGLFLLCAQTKPCPPPQGEIGGQANSMQGMFFAAQVL